MLPDSGRYSQSVSAATTSAVSGAGPRGRRSGRAQHSQSSSATSLFYDAHTAREVGLALLPRQPGRRGRPRSHRSLDRRDPGPESCRPGRDSLSYRTTQDDPRRASRARRHVRGSPQPDPDLARQREAADAFSAASRDGDFDALVAMLDPDVELRIDGGAQRAEASLLLRGTKGRGRAHRHLFQAVPIHSTGARQRRCGSRGHTARATVLSHGLHRHRRKDHPHRRARRPWPTRPARPHVP